MTTLDDVGTFKIVVESSNTIRAEQIPNTEGKIEKCEINRDFLRWKTVRVLIDMLRDNRLRRRKEFEFLGENLYSVLFNNAIGKALNKAVYVNQQMKYWKVELEFESEQHVLASWPWEYLYCPPLPGMGGGYFLAESAKLVLTRCLPLYLPPRNLLVPEKDLPIRVLFVAASPGKLSPVEYESILEELKGLEEQYKDRITVFPLVDPYAKLDGILVQKYNPNATFSKFFDMVLNFDPHIIHFVGHGRCLGEEGGQLAFMDLNVNGDAHWVTDNELASKLMGTSLRLVFLQACESALPSSPYSSYEALTDLHHNPYEAISGVAMHLAKQNIPAVVAMQYRIQSQVANEFARAFYTALADRKSVDAAMQEGRLKILTQISDWAKTSSFGLPVLYLQQSGSLLALKPETTGTSAQTELRQGAGAYMRGAAPAVVNVALSSISTTVAEDTLKQSFSCPWCQAICDPNDKFCECGKPLVCPQCKTRITRSRSNCGECGKPLPLMQDSSDITMGNTGRMNEV